MEFKDKILKQKFYDQEYELIPVKHKYADNGRIAIELIDLEDGERFADLTVNLPSSITDSSCAYLDANGGRVILDIVQQHGLGTPTGRNARSGFCVYPEYKFDLSKMATEEEVNEYFNGQEEEMG